MVNGNDDFILLRFVPTMRCNFRCPYCFLRHSNSAEPTMFDKFSVEKWLNGIYNFSNYNIEIYLWGGEPFCIPETFELIFELEKMKNINAIRIDTNMSFSKKIIRKCPSEKLRLNCSWHTKYFSYAAIRERAIELSKYNMISMLNFVASDENMAYLAREGLNLDRIIVDFADLGIYMNVAADFAKGAGDEYRTFITKYVDPDDWAHIHGVYPPNNVPCKAGEAFFTVNHDGTLTSCARKSEVIGNLFEGSLNRKSTRCPNGACPSIISYAFREDTPYMFRDHLFDYSRRNILYRRRNGLYTDRHFPNVN